MVKNSALNCQFFIVFFWHYFAIFLMIFFLFLFRHSGKVGPRLWDRTKDPGSSIVIKETRAKLAFLKCIIKRVRKKRKSLCIKLENKLILLSSFVNSSFVWTVVYSFCVFWCKNILDKELKHKHSLLSIKLFNLVNLFVLKNSPQGDGRH